MAYYIRVLSPESAQVPRSTIEKSIGDLGLPLTISGDRSDADWEEIVVSHPDGKHIAAIECNRVGPGGIAEEEIDEFLDEVSECQPAAAAAWLTTYLPTVQVIYAIQGGSGTDVGRGWDAIGAVMDAIRSSVKGIVQADNEGFSNEEGYHILWQFPPEVTGTWSMAVLKDDRWHKFRMDLGNETQRAHFLNGDVPPGVELID
jgi:hypothetical protein